MMITPTEIFSVQATSVKGLKSTLQTDYILKVVYSFSVASLSFSPLNIVLLLFYRLLQ